MDKLWRRWTLVKVEEEGSPPGPAFRPREKFTCFTPSLEHPPEVRAAPPPKGLERFVSGCRRRRPLGDAGEVHNMCMYVCIYIGLHMYLCVCLCIYIYNSKYIKINSFNTIIKLNDYRSTTSAVYLITINFVWNAYLI